METTVTDFTAWGIAADWPSLRWIELIHGRRNQPARGVRLGHASDTAMVLTCTYPRARVDHEASVWGFDPVREMAFETTYTQANLALHQISTPTERPHGLVGSLVSHACERANSFRDWPVTRWGTQEARISHLANWHSGFSLGYPDAYVIVHACGIGIDEVEPVQLADLSDYELSRDPAELGAMHWELWQARPDFSCEQLAAMLALA
jgi:hypothetical protein